MPHLSAQCSRCHAEDIAIVVKPYDIYCRKGSFTATEWEQQDQCECQDGKITLDAAEISRLLDLHPDTEGEWREGRAERAEFMQEATKDA